MRWGGFCWHWRLGRVGFEAASFALKRGVASLGLDPGVCGDGCENTNAAICQGSNRGTAAVSSCV
jgi:hypothetical protein